MATVLRNFAYLRLYDGVLRFDSLDYHATPEALQAESEVMDAIKEYEQGGELKKVREAFNVWKQIQTELATPRTLFV
jgi:hypothetical protein